MAESRKRSPRNRTIRLEPDERACLAERLLRVGAPVSLEEVLGRTIVGDFLAAAPFLPRESVDLAVVDPPYNLTKSFGDRTFHRVDDGAYEAFTVSWLAALLPLLKPCATVYVCADWRSSTPVRLALGKYLRVQNRITWEREKGRGARCNWKNSSEDIWFCTVSGRYTFNVEAVKLKRRVIAPYRKAGKPKDWEETAAGGFRLTHPSNLWTDLTVPYWSMAENTTHSTQKPEKLVAKLLLASSRAGDVVFDPFLGSGTTSVVARKLERRFFGIELDQEFACVAEKRLGMAAEDTRIQGYTDGVFWERNTQAAQLRKKGRPAAPNSQRKTKDE